MPPIPGTQDGTLNVNRPTVLFHKLLIALNADVNGDLIALPIRVKIPVTFDTPESHTDVIDDQILETNDLIPFHTLSHVDRILFNTDDTVLDTALIPDETVDLIPFHTVDAALDTAFHAVSHADRIVFNTDDTVLDTALIAPDTTDLIVFHTVEATVWIPVHTLSHVDRIVSITEEITAETVSIAPCTVDVMNSHAADRTPSIVSHTVVKKSVIAVHAVSHNS